MFPVKALGNKKMNYISTNFVIKATTIYVRITVQISTV
jgi:hypothetical protein